jgi:phosphoribosylglycinamide formyltransferase-1
VTRFAILFSGRGSNLETILEHWSDPEANPDTRSSTPVLGLSNRPNAGGLDRAAAAGLRSAVVDHKKFTDRASFEDAMIARLEEARVEWIVCAGFMRVLTPRFLRHYEGRVLNTHPALLPSFPGLDAPQQAIDEGVKVSGCTVHFVEEGVDTGPIIAQGVVPVERGDSAESLGERIRRVEHALYPQVIARVLVGRVHRDGRQVLVDGSPLGTR